MIWKKWSRNSFIKSKIMKFSIFNDFKMFSSLDHQPREWKKKYCKHKQSLDKGFSIFFSLSFPQSSISNSGKFACCLFFCWCRCCHAMYTYIREIGGQQNDEAEKARKRFAFYVSLTRKHYPRTVKWSSVQNGSLI